MKTTLTAIFLSLALVETASADVTLKLMATGKVLGISGNAPATAYIKGNKMRSEIQLGDKTLVTIFDIDDQKMYIFDTKKKQADVWNMADFAEEISKHVDLSSMKASIKPTGQTKQIAGSTATGYDIDFSMQSAWGGDQQMMMTVKLQGPIWIVKGAPGAAEYNNFYKTAVEKGWIFSDPRVAKSQPGQAKAMAQMYKLITDIGGIAYESAPQIQVSGEGPMAGILERISKISFTTLVTKIETGALADDLFRPPNDYKLIPKR